MARKKIKAAAVAIRPTLADWERGGESAKLVPPPAVRNCVGNDVAGARVGNNVGLGIGSWVGARDGCGFDTGVGNVVGMGVG